MNCEFSVSSVHLRRLGAVIQTMVFAMCGFCAWGQTPAEETYTPPPRTVEDVLAVLDQFKPDPARVNQLRDAVAKNPPDTTDRVDLFKFYWERAQAGQELGMVTQTLADLRKALELASPNDPENWYTYGMLAYSERLVGNYATAVKLLKESPKFAKIGGQPLASWAYVSIMQAELGDFGAARDALNEAEAGLRTQLSTNKGAYYVSNNWRSVIETARGDILRGEGKYGQAETAYRQALEFRNRQIAIQAAGVPANVFIPPIGVTVRSAVNIESNKIGTTLIEQGKYAEAELAARNALKRALSYFGKYSSEAGVALTRLARCVFEQGRFGDANVLTRAVVDIYQTIGASSNSLLMVNAQRLIGATLVENGKYADAETVFRAVREALLKDPTSAELLGTGTIESVYAQIRLGNTAEAVEQARGIYELQKKLTGDELYVTLEARGFYALALASNRKYEDALREYRAAIPGLLATSGERSGDQVVGRTRRLNRILEGYLMLLAHYAGNGQSPVAGIDAVGESFRIADVVRGSFVQHALSASAARASIGDSNLAALARQEQDDQQRLGVLTAFLPRLLAAPPEQQLPKIIADLTKEIETLRSNRTKLKAEIEKRFPDYANLIDPKPPTLEQARSALREGEALISIYVGADSTYVWAIPKAGAPAFTVVPQGEKEVARIVAELRNAFDAGDGTIAKFPKFDVGAAHKLYSALLAPVESGWKNATSLLIVPHRALGQLPFSLLVTSVAQAPADAATPFAGYKQVPWLIRKAAITQLPSVNALVTLRAAAQPAGERRAFIGFGDPYFSKEQQAQAGSQGAAQVAMVSRGITLRNLSIAKVVLQMPATPGAEKLTAAMRNAPDVANSSTLAQLPRLTETADEINEIAQALNADIANDVFLGVKANEKNVKSTNLSNRKVIAFATHGLVPGDLNGLEQPALALTSPEVAGIEGDGLLAMDEILGLKLNADWVVLSACNTASGDGAGAEAVSGLGRAFFYAGARALLVSNWPVETRSARMLTTDLFKRQAENPGLARAEALRQTMLGLMDGQGQNDTTGKMQFSYAHPMFWAPFSLVGDGAGR